MTVRDIDFSALTGLRGSYGAHYPRGRVLFRENDTTSEMYVVLQGSVALMVRDTGTSQLRLVRSVGPGEFFGEMSCFVGRPRAATAVVAEDAVLLRFGREAAQELLGTNPRFALGIIQTLCDRIVSDGRTIVELGGRPPAANGRARRAQ